MVTAFTIAICSVPEQHELEDMPQHAKQAATRMVPAAKRKAAMQLLAGAVGHLDQEVAPVAFTVHLKVVQVGRNATVLQLAHGVGLILKQL